MLVLVYIVIVIISINCYVALIVFRICWLRVFEYNFCNVNWSKRCTKWRFYLKNVQWNKKNSTGAEGPVQIFPLHSNELTHREVVAWKKHYWKMETKHKFICSKFRHSFDWVFFTDITHRFHTKGLNTACKFAGCLNNLLISICFNV